MKQFFKILIYLLILPTSFWLAFSVFGFLLVFSYSGHMLAWIPYIILGCWVPGKFYGLTLLHSMICAAISIKIIGFFDKNLYIGKKVRLFILIIASLLFSYEIIFNYFFQSGQDSEISQFRQFALLQLSFLIGILIKIFDPKFEIK